MGETTGVSMYPGSTLKETELRECIVLAWQGEDRGVVG
jgi:hypothetical protein